MAGQALENRAGSSCQIANRRSEVLCPCVQIGLEGHTQRAVQKLAGKSAPPAVDLLPHRSHSLDDATCDGFEAWTKFSQQKRLTEPAPTAAVAAVTGGPCFPTADCVLHLDAQA